MIALLVFLIWCIV